MTIADPFAAAPVKTKAAQAAPKKEAPVATTKTTAPKAAPVEDAPPVDYTDAFSAFMAQIGGGELEFGDEEFEAPVAFVAYQMPPDKEWIPVRIANADVIIRELNLVLDMENPTLTTPVSVPHFKLEADHASTVYGERMRPYLLTVPVFDVTFATKKGGTFKKVSGRKLLAASGVASRGSTMKFSGSDVDAMVASIVPYAEQLVGATVMARVKHVTKEYDDVNPLRDPATGEFIYDEATGEIKKEITKTVKVFDNLDDDVTSVPERGVVVDEVAYEITMNTVGRITTKPVKPNTLVTAVSEDKTIVAKWTGEDWVEHTVEAEVPAAGSDDVFKGN